MNHHGQHSEHTLKQNTHDHHQMMIRDFKKRFWWSLLVSIPILFLSPDVQSLFNFSLKIPGNLFILFILSTFVYFYGGKPFLIGLKQELAKMRPGMMTLIGMAITTAYIYSTAVVFGLSGHMFFWELATLIDIMLLGHLIEMRSVAGASKALEKLAQLMPSLAHRIISNNTIEDISVSEVKIHDRVLIKPGEKVSADGIVVEGESEVNESALTGESVPVSKSKGSKVIAGSLNENGSLVIEVTKDQKENYIATVIKLVSQVMESKSHAQDLANKAALILTIVALVAGTITFAAWAYFGNITFALERMVTVMVIACPHALGLAIPLVIAMITSLSAQQGLLIRNRLAFEEARDITMVVFDKTGTLTYGKFQVTDVISLGDKSQEEILALGASTSDFAKHGIVTAMVAKAQESGLKPLNTTNGKTIPGQGTYCKVDGKDLFVGNQKLINSIQFKSSDVQSMLDKSLKIAQELMQQGKTAVFVATDESIEGIIAAADVIRPESHQACINLKERGILIAMITGDNKFNAQVVGNKLDIDKVLAEVLPQEKASEIKKLQQEGYNVAMVGDGINDAPALAQANLGVAIGAGTDVAIETADIVLVGNDPRKVVDIINLSALTRRKMIQNLLWATGYNIIALPLAAGMFYRFGVTISPAIGAIFMSVSTVIVAINSRLISYK